MGCQAAPVARAFSDQALRLPGTRYLGICGDQDHNKRCSGHNAGPLCTDKGKFTPGYAHASDTGVPDVATGMRLVHAATQGPAQNTVLYAIYRGVGYYPRWRGGGTFKASGHPDHVHVSHVAGSTFLTPDFGITPPEIEHPALPEDTKETDPMAATRLIKVKGKPGPAAIVSWDGSGKTVQQLASTDAANALAVWSAAGIPTLEVDKAVFDDIVGGKAKTV